MSEVLKAKVNPANPYLPTPNLPTMDMPTPPVVPGVDPSKAQHTACDPGEICENLINPEKSPDSILPPPPGIPRILIGVPILSYSNEFVQSFMKFWTQISSIPPASRKFEAGYHFVYRKPVHMAEQEIVNVAQYNKCTHVLFMDDDIYDITIEDLNKLIETDKDVIAGIMYASRFPHAMCAFRRYDTTKKVIDMPSDNSMYRLYEIPCMCNNPQCCMALSHWDMKYCPACGTEQNNLVQKVDLIPFCFTLIKMSVFDRIKKPYFHCGMDYPTDSFFGDRCIEAGIQEWAHMGVRLNHLGCNDDTRQHMFQIGLIHAQKKTNSIVNLTMDQMHQHEALLHNKMKEAEAKLKPKLAFVSPEKEKAAEVPVVGTEPAVAGEKGTNDSTKSVITEIVKEKRGFKYPVNCVAVKTGDPSGDASTKSGVLYYLVATKGVRIVVSTGTSVNVGVVTTIGTGTV